MIYPVLILKRIKNCGRSDLNAHDVTCYYMNILINFIWNIRPLSLIIWPDLEFIKWPWTWFWIQKLVGMDKRTGCNLKIPTLPCQPNFSVLLSKRIWCTWPTVRCCTLLLSALYRWTSCLCLILWHYQWSRSRMMNIFKILSVAKSKTIWYLNFSSVNTWFLLCKACM